MTVPALSERQKQIALLVAAGFSNKEIATETHIAEHTVKNVVHSLFDRLGLWNRVELANYFSDSLSQSQTSGARQRIERERLRILHGMNILDSEVEAVFDDLTLLACTIADAPMGLLVLADTDRLWFKSRVGFTQTEVQRNQSFCHQTIQVSEILIIPDALQDHRFAASPLVLQPPQIRFYAGVPMLNEDGYAIGVLCVLDRVPRTLSRGQVDSLQCLARLTLKQLEFRNSVGLLQTAV